MVNVLCEKPTNDLLAELLELIEEKPKINEAQMLEDYINSSNSEIIRHFKKKTRKRVEKGDYYERYVFEEKQLNYILSKVPDLIVSIQYWEGRRVYVLNK